MAATQQFMLRLPQAAVDRLAAVAIERGFTGGRGRHGSDEPNKAEAARWLLGQADEQIHAIIYEHQETNA
jgi:hypothetical protein